MGKSVLHLSIFTLISILSLLTPFIAATPQRVEGFNPQQWCTYRQGPYNERTGKHDYDVTVLLPKLKGYCNERFRERLIEYARQYGDAIEIKKILPVPGSGLWNCAILIRTEKISHVETSAPLSCYYMHITMERVKCVGWPTAAFAEVLGCSVGSWLIAGVDPGRSFSGR